MFWPQYQCDQEKVDRQLLVKVMQKKILILFVRKEVGAGWRVQMTPRYRRAPPTPPPRSPDPPVPPSYFPNPLTHLLFSFAFSHTYLTFVLKKMHFELYNLATFVWDKLHSGLQNLSVNLTPWPWAYGMVLINDFQIYTVKKSGGLNVL